MKAKMSNRPYISTGMKPLKNLILSMVIMFCIQCFFQTNMNNEIHSDFL